MGVDEGVGGSGFGGGWVGCICVYILSLKAPYYRAAVLPTNLCKSLQNLPMYFDVAPKNMFWQIPLSSVDICSWSLEMP